MENEAAKILEIVDGLSDCFVAGGAVTSVFTNRPIADFDVYAKNLDGLEAAISWGFEAGWNVHASSRALTFSINKGETQVQVMTFDVFESADRIFEAFDFTCCMGALDLDAREFVFHEDFLKHCSQRLLKFNPNTRFPYASAWRIQKYQDKGFTIGKMEFMKILVACQNSPIKSWDELKEQIGGVYGEALGIPDDENFTFEGALRALNDVRPQPPEPAFEDAQEAILKSVKRKREFTELPYGRDGSEVVTLTKIGGHFEPTDEPPEDGVRVSPTAVYPDGLFYKVVKRDGDQFRAKYRNSFVYRVGDIAVSDAPFLYVTTAIDAVRRLRQYGKNAASDHAIIELKAGADEIIYGPETRIKKAMVSREVTDELLRTHESDAENEDDFLPF
jgi:hypothetical protein